MAKVSAKSHAKKSADSKAPTKNARLENAGSGGELHQTAGGDVDTLTTQQGIPVADDQNSLRQGAARRRRCWKTFTSARKSFISTMSAFRSASCMPAAMPRMAFSN